MTCKTRYEFRYYQIVVGLISSYRKDNIFENLVLQIGVNQLYKVVTVAEYVIVSLLEGTKAFPGKQYYNN